MTMTCNIEILNNFVPPELQLEVHNLELMVLTRWSSKTHSVCISMTALRKTLLNSNFEKL